MPDNLSNINTTAPGSDIGSTDLPPLDNNQPVEPPLETQLQQENQIPQADENLNAQNVEELFEDRPSFLGDQAIIGGQKDNSKHNKSVDFNKTYNASVKTNNKKHLKEIIIIGLGVFLLLIAGGIYLFINKDRFFGQQTVPSDQTVVPTTIEEEPSGKIEFGDTKLPIDINSDDFIRSVVPISHENNMIQKTNLLQQLDISSINLELMRISLL